MALFHRKKQIDAPEPEEEPLRLPGAPETDMSGRRSIGDHRDYLCSLVQAVSPVAMELPRAVGLAVCEDIHAPHDVPVVTTAAIDGYALDSASTKLAGRPGAVEIQVDRRPPTPVTPGTAVRVMAGSLLPEGTDCVLPLDLLDVDGEIVLFSPVKRWVGARLAGSDYGAGEVLVRNGTILHPGIISMLALAGIDEVFVRPRPKVVIVALRADESQREEVEKRARANGAQEVGSLGATAAAIESATRALDVDVTVISTTTSNEAEVTRLLSNAGRGADLVLATSDRMVAGQQDAVSSVLPHMGGSDFARVAMEPGANQGFALLDPSLVPLVVLPAGPGPALISFMAFVQPLLRKLSGLPPTDELKAETDRPIARHPDSTTFVPVRLARVGGRPVLSRAGMGDVTHAVDLSMADAIAVIGAGDEPVPTGMPLVCWRLR
ncbi:molybdopterin biosynthesis protein [Cutibacterium equinum]|uniref:Molybdopterin molybdenumtransferase n=1 Tax=Cutibacterium equinum TaxID=3016342 RepID=A0ABY7QZ98_9ACTN|nr:gephyrin-like molybdotransferase Glp [Cutibacterium equinum]WCC80363.1 molybdopterin biosynthesis protein [Cutibacterium equinum]